MQHLSVCLCVRFSTSFPPEILFILRWDLGEKQSYMVPQQLFYQRHTISFNELRLNESCLNSADDVEIFFSLKKMLFYLKIDKSDYFMWIRLGNSRDKLSEKKQTVIRLSCYEILIISCVLSWELAWNAGNTKAYELWKIRSCIGSFVGSLEQISDTVMGVC